MAERKKAGSKVTRPGRPPKFDEGSVNVSTYFPVSMAEDLKRYTAYLTSVDGIRRGYTDVLIAALLAYRPFREWRRNKESRG